MTKPSKCISVVDARKLQDNWVETRGAEISKAQGTDQREFIYSVDELQEFLDYVKDESNKQGIKSPGIRIYFGAYDNSESKLATVFLAPTKGGKIDSENNYNIDAFNFAGGGWPPRNY